MGMEERIPDLSDLELERLHTNAVRLAQGGSAVQRSQADVLLPIIAAALDQRRVAHAAAQLEARNASIEKRVVAAKAAKRRPLQTP